jgi:hypothetical protein
MKGLAPVLQLLRTAILPPLLRLKARHLNVMAPADMHLAIALRLADLERR